MFEVDLWPVSFLFMLNELCAPVFVQGEVVHWLACSLYAACRKGSTPTVGKGLMEGNCVSLTRILRTAKLRSVSVATAIQKNHLANHNTPNKPLKKNFTHKMTFFS